MLKIPLQEYKNTTWTQPEIAKWISANIHQVSAWLAPPGSKSTTLAPYLKRGPAVLLFTPRIHYTRSNDAYTMVRFLATMITISYKILLFQLRQIALEYYNCPSTNRDWIEEMSRDYMTQQRIKSQEQHHQFQETCRKLLKTARLRHIQRCSQTQSTVSVIFANIVNSSNDKLPGQRIFGPKNIDEQTACFSQSYSDYDSCDAVPALIYDGRSDQRGHAKHGISMLDVENDDRFADSLVERDTRLKCETFAHGDEENVMFFEDQSPGFETDLDSLSGLSCKSNRTLSFLAVDSLLYHTFAERLGVNVLKHPKKSVVLIMDYEVSTLQ